MEECHMEWREPINNQTLLALVEKDAYVNTYFANDLNGSKVSSNK